MKEESRWEELIRNYSHNQTDAPDRDYLRGVTTIAAAGMVWVFQKKKRAD